MFENTLPFPGSESRFWREVAFRWVKSAGLVLAVVPADLNVFFIGRWLRDHACSPPISDRDLYALAPDARCTYCYDLSQGGEPATVCGSELLPRVLSDLDKEEVVARAVQGESSFYLMLTGVAIPANMSINQWARSVVQKWPASRPSSPLSRFFCCSIVTASWPASQPALPEGSDCMVFTDGCEEEISFVVQETVDSYWQREDLHARRYLCSGLVDMASGRRTHAELALNILRTEWESGRAREPNWRPHWPTESRVVQQTRDALQKEGLGEESNLLMVAHGSDESRNNEIGLAQRLWAQGLWRSSTKNGSPFLSPTSLAEAALKAVQPDDTAPRPFLPDATMYVLRQVMEVEQQIKHWLGQFLDSTRSRERLQKVLDAPSDRNYEIARRDYVLQQFPEWSLGLSVEKRRQDAIVVRMCSFGMLKEILFDLIAIQQRKELIRPLTALIRARNLAAHGGWFSLREYREICEQTDQVIAMLPSLRLE